MYKKERGIWIPKDTVLGYHPSKSTNYSFLSELQHSNIVLLDPIVSIPYLPIDLESRIGEAKSQIQSIFSQKEIGLFAEDFMIRCAFNFEDTHDNRAAGIGRSRRITPKSDLDAVLREILNWEDNPNVIAYTQKHNIGTIKIGLQLCNTLINQNYKYATGPDLSGSIKLISPDLVEVGFNNGFAFNYDSNNKFPITRFLYSKKDQQWEEDHLLYDRDDLPKSHIKHLDNLRSYISSLLEYFDVLIQSGKFKEGYDLEFVIPDEKLPSIHLVQNAPIKFMNNEKLTLESDAFDYVLGGQQDSVIIGHGERYYPKDKIFLYFDSDQIQELNEFNKNNPDGYLLISETNVWREQEYSTVYNATAIIGLSSHNGISDHFANIGRENDVLIAYSNDFSDRSEFRTRVYGEVGNSFLDQGLTLQIDEKTQVYNLSLSKLL